MNIIDLSIIHYSNSHDFYIPFEIRKIIKEFTYEEINDKNIHSAVKLWCNNKEKNKKKAIILYGHISYWDTSKVTDMSCLFEHLNKFNDDISNWYISKVTNMKFMFCCASSFNQPIGNWDVSQVTNMEYMFCCASSFNQPICNWNVSQVTNMEFMFSRSYLFDQSVTNWDVSKVTDMESMFYYASSFNQPIENWNVSHVTNMKFMFILVPKSLKQSLITIHKLKESKLLSWKFHRALSGRQLKTRKI